MMSINLYEDIIHTIDIQPKLRECQTALENKYPTVSPLTLSSILNCYVQKKMKATYSKHNTPEKAKEYYERFLQAVESNEKPGIIMRISDEVGICPVLIARVVLQAYIKDCQAKELENYAKENNKNEPNESSNDTSSQPVLRAEINQILRDTTLIVHKELSYEVHLCTVNDDFYGPMPDVIRQTMGHEYEEILRQKLQSLGITFVDEGDLRQTGFDKTPDFKLEVPIGIEGRVVNWIESKALFGDQDSHQTYLNEQLLSYWNRFGPGLVIYWLGYCETLDSITVPGIFIRDHLPIKIKFMDPNCPTLKPTALKS